MLDVDKTCLVVVDVQGKLAQRMVNKEVLFKNIRILIYAFNLLKVPILWCQQSPDALGPTEASIQEALGSCQPINKASFSCWPVPAFQARLGTLNRSQVVLCGIEAHVCVYQTAVDLLGHGRHVEVVADAVSSRTAENRAIALERLRAEGMAVTSVEMLLFELLRTAEHPQFRDIARLIK